MKLRRRECHVLLGTAALWPLLAHAAVTPPLADFFQRAQMDGAELNPGGTRLALRVGGGGGRRRLVVLDLSNMKSTPVATFKDADIYQFRWVNDERLAFNLVDESSAPADQRFAFGLFAVDADGQRFKQLAQREHVWVKDNVGTEQLPWNTFMIDQRGAQRGDEILVGQPQEWEGGASFHKLLRLNTVNGLATELDTPPRSYGWLLDAQDQARIALTERADKRSLHLREGEAWTLLREGDKFSDEFEPQGIGPDGSLYVCALQGQDRVALYRYDLTERALQAKPLLALAEFDVLRPELLFDEQRLLGVRLVADATTTVWFDAKAKALQAAVDARLAQTSNLLSLPRRGDSPWVLVRAFSDQRPMQYLLFHRDSGKLTLLGQQQPQIDAAQMGSMDFVHYKARDGRTIPAYLTLPREAKQPLPLIVWVHGGPWVRGTSWRWQNEVQFLVSRGYAVLQPEFRGSVGFGQSHFKASWKQWGLAMQDDLADGARWAIAQGIADPKRIAILGASYGGYAAMMGLVRDPELYACAVNWVGVTDLDLMYGAHWSDIGKDAKRYGLPLVLGDRQSDAKLLHAQSPVHRAAEITRPVLMAYGRVDRRVPIEHGERLRDALRGKNAQLEWVVYDKEAHGWSQIETELDFWGRVERFLARNLVGT